MTAFDPVDDPTMDRSYEPTSAAPGLARHDSQEWLLTHQVDADRCDRIVLAVSELVSNASSASPTPVRLRLRLSDDGDVSVAVRNAGGPGAVPDRRDWGPDTPLAVRGRGLDIVDQLSDRVKVDESNGSITVVASFVATR